jgi:hypothetical protein
MTGPKAKNPVQENPNTLGKQPIIAEHAKSNQVAAGAFDAREYRKYIMVDNTTASAEATAAKRNTCA